MGRGSGETLRTVFRASYVVNCTAEYGMICRRTESDTGGYQSSDRQAHPRAINPVPSHEPGIPFLLVHSDPSHHTASAQRLRIKEEWTHNEAQTPPYAFPLVFSLPVVVSRG